MMMSPRYTDGCSGAMQQAKLTHGIRGVFWHQAK